ncbi:MAG: hypothetical protein QME94_14040 [Anaerolineae bacterium]|nr:hypothetical protein [Anaerolineae bacterium]
MNAREHWDREAPRYAAGVGERRYPRFLELYEANCWRTALELARGGEMAALMGLLDTGLFHRPDGLADHRFEPGELVELFVAHGMELLHLAALCPFSSYLPDEAEAGILDDPKAYETMLQVAGRYAEDPAVIALTGRLLVVARRRGRGGPDRRGPG